MASQYQDVSLARYAQERKYLREQGFTEIESKRPDIMGEWQGTIAVEVNGRTEPINVTFQIAFPNGYPWQKPYCVPIEPAYRRCQHQERDSLAAATWPNRLCIWEDHTGGWDPSFGLQEVIDKVRGWVKATEMGWHTRSTEDAAVFDLDRYFACTFGPIYFSDGVGALKSILGTLEVLSCDRCMIVTAIDGVPCPSAKAAIDVLNITPPQTSTTIPYIVCSQPSFPLFADLSGLLRELTRQGFDRNSVVQHLGKAISGQPNYGAVVIAYEAIDARVACGLRYELPETVQGFRRRHAPGTLRVKHAGESRCESSEVVCLDSETLLRRNPSRMHTKSFRNAKVAVFGLGSIGSQVAELLAKGGVDGLLLIDADKLEAGNVMRHTIGLEGVGQSKATAVRERLRRFRIDGSFEIPACASDGVCRVETCMNQLSSALGGYGVLIDCTANEIVQDYLMREAIKVGSHYCRVQSYQGGSIGEVIIADPTGPCAACIEEKADTNPVYAMSGLPKQEIAISEGCASVTQPASAADLSVICGVAVAGMLDLLLERALPWNLRYWVAHPISGVRGDSIFVTVRRSTWG